MGFTFAERTKGPLDILCIGSDPAPSMWLFGAGQKKEWIACDISQAFAL